MEAKVSDREEAKVSDPTEAIRREQLVDINTNPVPSGERTWTTDELTAEFEVLGFLAPYVIVRRKADGTKGSLMFKHSPRVYFGWQEDS
jgi:hypothetical protein